VSSRRWSATLVSYTWEAHDDTNTEYKSIAGVHENEKAGRWQTQRTCSEAVPLVPPGMITLATIPKRRKKVNQEAHKTNIVFDDALHMNVSNCPYDTNPSFVDLFAQLVEHSRLSSTHKGTLFRRLELESFTLGR
jgi:hypothetical protein